MKNISGDNPNRNSNNYFSSIDIHFGNFIAGMAPENKDYLFPAAALVSRAVRFGHICLDLNTLAGNTISSTEEGEEVIACPELKTWLEALRSAPCVGLPGDFKPLILDAKNRLYLQRYWQYEQDVARNILSRISSLQDFQFDKTELAAKLNLYFPENPGGDATGNIAISAADDPQATKAEINNSQAFPGLTLKGASRVKPGMTNRGAMQKSSSEGKTNWQKVAAVAAMFKKFLVISGSPGTGKTTAITKIMALILAVGKRKLRIALAAPTGKAAARLQESVQKTKAKLICAEAIRELIPDEAQTIHRLLGSISDSPYFRFNEGNPLPYDLVVVDEASMIDLPLLAKLFQAMPPAAQIILLGDKDQLASVDAGVVLGDICADNAAAVYSQNFAAQVADLSGEKLNGADIPAGVQDSIIQLQTNYRFSAASGINILSHAVQTGNVAEVFGLLPGRNHSDIDWIDLSSRDLQKKFTRAVIAGYSEYLKAVNSKASAEEIFACLEKFRILCALRVGNWGTQRINAHVEKILSEAGLINPHGLFYEGMPVMVLQNDYRERLFNGDVGIILQERSGNREMRAFFRDEHGKLRKIIPARLPQHETVWAMTVHKSQGSEFDRVLLVLADRDVPVVTRELVYTGITRARRNIRIWAGKDVLTKAISRRISRQSGLNDALRNYSPVKIT